MANRRFRSQFRYSLEAMLVDLYAKFQTSGQYTWNPEAFDGGFGPLTFDQCDANGVLIVTPTETIVFWFPEIAGPVPPPGTYGEDRYVVISSIADFGLDGSQDTTQQPFRDGMAAVLNSDSALNAVTSGTDIIITFNEGGPVTSPSLEWTDEGASNLENQSPGAYAAAGGVALDRKKSKGIESIVRDSAGLFTLTLEDRYFDLLQLSNDMRNGTTPSVAPLAQASSVDLVNRQVQVAFLNLSDTLTDPAPEEEVRLHMVLSNSSVGN